MNKEYDPNPNFEPWGPFIPANFKNQPITVADVTITSIVWGLTLICAGFAMYYGYGQMKSSRSPLRSTYIWLIWLELLASVVMGLECFLHILKIIRPSFAFYFTILFCWCIQVQLLLQIIINRIRVIVPDRRHSKRIMIVTAIIVTAINISVFNIWIPARLQTSQRYIFINNIWDRCEKVIYLFLDAALNWYFLKVVKANLVNNGLQKYNKLLRFNQQIIVVSLLMDVMIIAAMSIPNSFVYIQFHPLAYLVKLNIEMAMANLIKRIAMSTSKRTGNVSIIQEFASSSNKSSSNHTGHTNLHSNHARRASVIELSSNILHNKRVSNRGEENSGRIVSFAPTGTQIKVTEEIQVRSEPDPEFSGKHGGPGMGMGMGMGVGNHLREIGKAKSLDDVTDVTEGGESVKSVEVGGQRRDDSDDEAVLMGQGKPGWRRLAG